MTNHFGYSDRDDYRQVNNKVIDRERDREKEGRTMTERQTEKDRQVER